MFYHIEASNMAYESFRSIYGNSDEQSTITSAYETPETLLNKAILYNEIEYRVYNTYSDFLHDLSHIPEANRTFHEVVFNLPQKLKFDIDSPIEKLEQYYPDQGDNVDQSLSIDDLDIIEFIDDLPEQTQGPRDRYNVILDTIRETIRDAFFVIYGRDFPQTCEVICESHCPNGSKFSNHIIIDGFYVQNAAEAREFTRRLIGMLPHFVRPFIDSGVNKTIQNFRFPDNHKREDTRVKRIITGHDIKSAIIRHTDGCELLPTITHVITAHPTRTCAEDIQAVVDICNTDKIFADYEFQYERNGFLVYTRKNCVECDLCREIHHHDVRHLYVTMVENNGVITILRFCRQYDIENGKDGSHYRVVGVTNSANSDLNITAEPGEQTPKAPKSGAEAAIERSLTHRPGVRPGLFARLPFQLKNEYSEPKLRDFELTNTLVVHAAMKMGKTKALKQLISQHFEDNSFHTNIIRFVSFRQTFSINIKEQFPDFTLYSDVRGQISEPRVIVQVESLHRLDITAGCEPPDLLVLDECESIFEQLNSGLMRGNFNDCFAKFQYLLRYSKHVICMDANISDRTYNILARMRPGFGGRGSLYHHNTYQNATEDRYYLCSDKVKWLGMVYSAIGAGDKIAMPISSLTEAKIIKETIQRNYPDLKVHLYSSETQPSEKREHFGCVNERWTEFDILIYTPTVSAGISFEEVHYDKIFAYFTDVSCPVETCHQMIGRIRNVGTHEFYVCISTTGNTLPETAAEIKEALLERRRNLFKDEHGLTLEYNADGSLQYKNDDYFTVWLENTRMINLSRNKFTRRFIDVVSKTGAQLAMLSDDIFESKTGEPVYVDGELNQILVDIGVTHKNIRKDIKQIEHAKVAQARDIDEFELDEIKDAMISQRDISEDDRAAYEKYRLRADFNYSGEITEKFVGTYNNPKQRRIYKNLTRISIAPTAIAALELIRLEERELHKYLLGLGEASHNQDINHNYVYDQHRNSISLINQCGWDDIRDQKFINAEELARTIKQNERSIWQTLETLSAELKLRKPNRAYGKSEIVLEQFLKYANGPLGIMYGLAITTSKKSDGMYYLRRSKLFTDNPTVSAAKGVPLIPFMTTNCQINQPILQIEQAADEPDELELLALELLI